MKPSFKLNYWQALLLFIPGIAGHVLPEFLDNGAGAYRRNFAIGNLSAVFNLLIIISYQAYLVVNFNRVSPKKSKLFVINALIPAIFFFIYFLYMLYPTFVQPLGEDLQIGPMKMAYLHGMTLIITIFLIHASITFLIINILFIKKQIERIQDPTEQLFLKDNFLKPVKIIVKTSVTVFAALIVVGVIVDLVKYSSKN